MKASVHPSFGHSHKTGNILAPQSRELNYLAYLLRLLPCASACVAARVRVLVWLPVCEVQVQIEVVYWKIVSALSNTGGTAGH